MWEFKIISLGHLSTTFKRCKSKKCSPKIIEKFEISMNSPKGSGIKPPKRSRKKPKGLKFEPLCQQDIRRITLKELIEVNMCNFLMEDKSLMEICKGRRNSHKCFTCEADGRNHKSSKLFISKLPVNYYIKFIVNSLHTIWKVSMYHRLWI